MATGETTSYHVAGSFAGGRDVEEVVAYWNGLEEFNDPIILRVINLSERPNTGRRRFWTNVEYKVDRGSPWVAHEDNNTNTHRLEDSGAHDNIIFNHPVSSIRLTLLSNPPGGERVYDAAIRGRRKRY